jgi:MFS family permease
VNHALGQAAGGSSTLQRAGRAFRHRNYRLYFLGQSFLTVGTWIHSVALGWLIWRLSASPFLLGMLALCDQGPIFILGIFSGAIIDRFDRRRILLVTQACTMFIVALLAVLTLAGWIGVAGAIGLTLALGVVNAFDGPARQSFVVELVGVEDLANAIALNSMLYNLARLIGPAVGGAIVAAFGVGWCFVVKEMTILPAVLALVLLRLERAPRPSRVGRIWREMGHGLRFIRRDPAAIKYLVLVGVCSFTSVPYFSFLPMLASNVLKSGPRGAGILMSLTGVGAVAGAINVTFRDRSGGMRNWPVWAALLLGLAQIGIGCSSLFWVTAILAVPVGFAILTQNLTANTLLQILVLPELRGRVMAFYAMMSLGTVPFGALASGVLASHLGLPATAILGGALCAATATAYGFADRLPRHPRAVPPLSLR